MGMWHGHVAWTCGMGMWMDMWMGMWMGMQMDMRMDMVADGQVDGHVDGQVYGHVYGHMYTARELVNSLFFERVLRERAASKQSRSDRCFFTLFFFCLAA